jgi:ribosomal protein S18 acetylase RimI-like enzyme
MPETGGLSETHPTGAYPGHPIEVELHTGSREQLRPLFEEAEDSQLELDSYLDAGEVLVAVEDGHVLGHVQLIESSPVAVEIKSLAVDPRCRRRGVGRALLAAAIERARSRGYTTLLVATAAAASDNLRFYQLAGFRMTSVERDAFSPANGYAADASIDGIPLRDRVWFDLAL